MTRPKTDDDYCRLDDAIGALTDWYTEVARELVRVGVSERSLTEVLAAMKRVHSPEDEDSR